MTNRCVCCSSGCFRTSTENARPRPNINVRFNGRVSSIVGSVGARRLIVLRVRWEQTLNRWRILFAGLEEPPPDYARQVSLEQIREGGRKSGLSKFSRINEL